MFLLLPFIILLAGSEFWRGRLIPFFKYKLPGELDAIVNVAVDVSPSPEGTYLERMDEISTGPILRNLELILFFLKYMTGL